MAIADYLQQFLRSFIPNAQSQLGEVSQLAIGGPQGYAQQQENARSGAQLAQQLNLHNTMTPYETQSLGMQRDAASRAAQQQQFEDLFKTQTGVAQGLFKPSQVGEPGAFTPPGGVDAFSPVKQPKSQTFTIGKDTPLGKGMGIESDIEGVPLEDYLKYMEKFAEKGKVNDQKAAALAQIQALRGQISDQIDQRFRPEHYQAIYGGVDPEADLHRRNFQNRLATGMAEDQAQGKSTQLQMLQSNIDTFHSDWEKMKEAERNRAATFAEHQGNVDAAREDRSYQFHAGELEARTKPLADTLTRASRLLMTLKQANPQADAEAAPEFLSVMAGGQGANLRMNQASIDNTKEGRTAWEKLKSDVAKYSLDPTHSIITDAQRKQMQDLAGQFTQYLNGKHKILVDARSKLANSSDVREHRRIYDEANKALEGVDVSGALGLPTASPAFKFPPPPSAAGR